MSALYAKVIHFFYQLGRLDAYSQYRYKCLAQAYTQSASTYENELPKTLYCPSPAYFVKNQPMSPSAQRVAYSAKPIRPLANPTCLSILSRLTPPASLDV